MSDAWIETFTGKKFHLLDPQEGEICIEDIAHSLSQQCRYTGHTRVFYSIAEHSYFVSLLADEKLVGLLHDASEAYLSDLSRPAKYLTPIGQPYFEVEDVIESSILRCFGLPADISPSVKKADRAMLLTEKSQLMTSLTWSKEDKQKWDADNQEALSLVLPCWTPKEAEARFLVRFKELQNV